MAKSEKQKQKLLILLEILKKNTDEDHGITMVEIIEALEKREVKAERKALYTDINALNEYGYNIDKRKRNGKTYYRLLNRDFELPELKLLVDAVQVSKFISPSRSTELIKKIENQASKYQAKELQRQVYVANRIKTDYDNVYKNIDSLNLAINENSQIKFDYYEWTLKKKMEIRANGCKTGISPWALTWDDENYYLIAYDQEADKIKHYRVDKIRQIEITDIPRKGKEKFDSFDMGLYAKKVFSMFTGDEQTVKIQFDNSLIGVVIDRFGKDVMIIPKGENKFAVNVKVSVSKMFLGWIMGLGDKAKIVGPQSVVDQMKQEIERMYDQYK